jgi:hypothetical protein
MQPRQSICANEQTVKGIFLLRLKSVAQIPHTFKY